MISLSLSLSPSSAYSVDPNTVRDVRIEWTALTDVYHTVSIIVTPNVLVRYDSSSF